MNKIKRPNLIRDSLYNTSRECIRYNTPHHMFDVRYGRGQLCGIVSTIMAMSKTRSFEEAVAIVAPMLPKDVDADCIPDSWKEEFAKHNAHAALKPNESDEVCEHCGAVNTCLDPSNGFVCTECGGES